MFEDIYMVAGKRTPFAKAGSTFAAETPLTLSAPVMQAMANQARPDAIVWGQVIPNLSLSNIAREAALDAGLDPTIPAYSTQLACSSSMMGAIQAAGMIGHGGISLMMVGGVEQMSNVPVGLTSEASVRLTTLAMTDPAAVPAALTRLKVGDVTLPKRGWSNRVSGRSMGDHMEETAKLLGIERVDQDRIAFQSHQNAANAQKTGFFDDLILPFAGLEKDMMVRADSTAEKLATLKPVFDLENGSLTAGNSSPLTDGAAGVWVANKAGLDRLPSNSPALRLVDFELGALDFQTDGMLMAPAYAIPRLLLRHGLTFADILIWEIHEAFAAQVLANIKIAQDQKVRSKHVLATGDLGEFTWDRVNLQGGSLAVGHPFAATGARLISQTAKALMGHPSGTKAILSICADGGQGTVMLVERP